MNKKLVLFFAGLLAFSQVDCFFYTNDQEITFKTIFTGSCATSVDYNTLNDKDGQIGGNKRLCGIHNMTVEVQGYEPVSLVKNDVCLYPALFTVLSSLLSDDNMFVQRWSCVKWILPLSFGFKVENDSLTVFSSIWKYRFLSLFRAQKTIELVKNSSVDNALSAQDLKITVTVNGRAVVVGQQTVVQIYSSSSLNVPLLLRFL